MSKIKYLDVVSGFDFKQRHGYAVPIINKILVNLSDFERVTIIVRQKREITALHKWSAFLNKLQIKNRLDENYGDI